MHRSFWLRQDLPADPPAAALGGCHTDVAVIGGGDVGLRTALGIKQLQPDAAVTVLEADVCGGGASGRNGGFVMTWWPKVASLVALCGRTEAPIPEQLADIGRHGGEAITDSQTLVCHYHTISDGRVAFGKGGWSIGFAGRIPDSLQQNDSRSRMVERDFRRDYPALRSGLVGARTKSFPPEPVKYLGGHVVREAIVHRRGDCA